MRSLALLGIAIGLLTACDRVDSSKTTQDADKSVLSEGQTAQSNANVTEVALGQATHAELLEQIQHHKGKVVVVDVWSTSCLPCMKEFPHLVELARRWPDEVVCVSMNVDYIGLPNEPVEKMMPKVVDFLNSQNAGQANMVNLVGSEPDTDMLAKLDVESMPAILVFDRNGQRVAKVTIDNAGDDGLTYAGDVLPLVESLVKPR